MNTEPTYRVKVSDRVKPLGWFWTYEAAQDWCDRFLASMPESQLVYVSLTIDEVQ